jgi:hypothetical protein
MDAFRAWRKLFPPSNPPISLYAIQAGDDGPVKIGIALKPWERLATLQTANPVRLRGLAAWPGSPAEEEALHKLFANDRLEGEWFNPSTELIALVDWLGAPTCEFVKPASCPGHRCTEPGTTLPAACESCGVEFD